MTQTRLHPDTGKLLRRDVRVQSVCVGSLSQDVDVAGWYPDDDSDSVHSGEDLHVVESTYRELRVAYAARIKAVRKKLGLTQEEAGRIIGGGRRAFQKYERGTMQPSEAAVGLIEILDRHPEEVETLVHLRRIAGRDGGHTSLK